MTEDSDGRGDGGKFTHGNAIWQLRERFGRPPVYSDPDELWAACCTYFEWAHENPLYEVKILGSGAKVSAEKMRAFTQKSLCLHLCISEEAWRDWRNNRDDLREVVLTVDAVIYSQKFEGASAGLLNPNIIARDLGLAERQEHTGRDGAPIETKETSIIETGRRLAFLLTKASLAQNNPTDTKEIK